MPQEKDVQIVEQPQEITQNEDKQLNKPPFTETLQKWWTKTKQITKETIKKISAFFASLSKIDYLHFFYYVIIFLSFINIAIMTLHLWDKNYNFTILPRSYISAIAPDQDITDTMYTDIVTIIEFDPDKAVPGDQVIFYGDFNINEYWVQEIVSIDYTNEEVSITYDGLSAIPVSFDEIVGTYIENSGIIGTMYYTAKYPRGYTLLMTIHLLVVAGIYFESFERINKGKGESK